MLKNGTQITLGTILNHAEAREAFNAAAGRDEFYKVETADSFNSVAMIQTSEIAFITFLDTVDEQKVVDSTRPQRQRPPSGLIVPR